MKVSEKNDHGCSQMCTVIKGSSDRHHSNDGTWRHDILRKNETIINQLRIITLHGWTRCLCEQIMNSWALCSCWRAIKSARHPMDFFPKLVKCSNHGQFIGMLRLKSSTIALSLLSYYTCISVGISSFIIYYGCKNPTIIGCWRKKVYVVTPPMSFSDS